MGWGLVISCLAVRDKENLKKWNFYLQVAAFLIEIGTIPHIMSLKAISFVSCISQFVVENLIWEKFFLFSRLWNLIKEYLATEDFCVIDLNW